MGGVREHRQFVMLAAASQREGAAFQHWKSTFCVFSVNAFSLSSPYLSLPFGFYYISSCCSCLSEERSKPAMKEVTPHPNSDLTKT